MLEWLSALRITVIGRPLGGPGYPAVEKALGTIRRHRMIEPGDTVVAAVSGGPDSMCLLDVLQRVPLELSIVVAHVDHGLSAESAEVAARVATHAAEAGLDAHVVRVSDLEGPNLQARARTLRYAFFESLASKEGATRVATAHTLDDRVETTLARLVHGAGTDGLAGIVPTDGSRVRPLIDFRRPETRAYCDECGIAYYDDPSNEDLRFERARVRARLIPAIEEQWGPGAINAMAVSAQRLHEDSSALGGLAERLFAELATVDEGGVRIPLPALLDMPRAFRRRLLELAVGRVRDRSGGIEAALDALESGIKPSTRFAVATGIEIFIEPDEVSISRMNE